MKIVVFGLTISSSWGNGHATTYRGLVRELTARGHRVLFLERDVPWYAENRDLAEPPYGRTVLYSNLEDLKDRFAKEVRSESRKITWTTWNETWINSILVFILVAVTAVFFLLVDGSLSFLIQQLLRLASS